MKNNEDIGDFFKEQLNKIKKTPKEELWDKITYTLDQKRKKKRLLYFWLTASSFALLILLFSMNFPLSKASIKNDNSLKKSSEKSKNDFIVKKNNVSLPQKKDSEFIKQTHGDSTKNIIINKKINDSIALKIKKEKELNKIKDSNTIITTTYYYTNSNKKTIKIADKKLIDSILNLEKQ